MLLVDSDADLRDALVPAVVRGGYPAAASASGVEALRFVGRGTASVVVSEVELPDISGYELCAEVRRLHASPPMILMSATRTDPLDRVAALLLGAADYLSKPFNASELLTRIGMALRPPTSSPARVRSLLTRREQEVLCLLADGLEQREISVTLLISPKTVATHVEHILSKLGARNRGQAIALAYRSGLMDHRAPPWDGQDRRRGDAAVVPIIDRPMGGIERADEAG